MRQVIIKTDNQAQIDLLLTLANQLNIEVSVTEQDLLEEKQLTANVATTSFAKDWNDDENLFWDEFLKDSPDVSIR